MAVQNNQRDRLVYTPGDGYVYRWSGGPWIEVHKITYTKAGERREEETPDVIATPEVTTGEQLMRTVDAWRQAR